MTQSATIGALVAALAKARLDFKPVIKSAANPFFKSKYADLAGILEAVIPALSVNGLAVYHTTKEDGDLILVTTLAHISGEFVSGEYPVIPVKQDPQGYGSAITYARRYAISAMLSIAAEDDDGEAASGRNTAPAAKVASVSGAAMKKKPTWSTDQTTEVGTIFAEILHLGGDTGSADISKLRKEMGYDLPSDVIDAASALLNKWRDVEHAAQNNQDTP